MRSADGALTRITGTLLLEGLATCTGNFTTVLGLVGTLTCGSKLCNDNLVQQGYGCLRVEKSLRADLP